MNIDEENNQDVKGNMPSFYNHLHRWIDGTANSFFLRDYESAFECLKNLYVDSVSIYSPQEKEELKLLFERAFDSCSKLSIYNRNYLTFQSRVKPQYVPPPTAYHDLVAFRMRLMELLGQHGVLLPSKNQRNPEVF